MTVSETELIRRAQADDTEAFCALAEQYARRIYVLAFHYCRNAQDAEDLSQEVWLKAYQALRSFRSQSTFYTWLRRITINTFLNHQRSNSSERLTRVDDWPFASEETVYNKVLFETVMSALASLSPSQRLMFLLRHYEGMSYDEIASAMNCSAGTAKKAVWRAITKLRVKLEIRNDTSDETVAGLAAETRSF